MNWFKRKKKQTTFCYCPNCKTEYKRDYEVVKWGYSHGPGDSEPSVLWVKARARATKKKEKHIYMEFERNEDFEINYQHLQY